MMKSRRLSLRISHLATLLASASLFLKPFAYLVKDTGNIPKSFGCWQSPGWSREVNFRGQGTGPVYSKEVWAQLLPKKPPNCCSSPEGMPDDFSIDWKREVTCSLASTPSRPECLWILRTCAQIAHKLGTKAWCRSHHLIRNSQHWILPSSSWRKFPVERVQEWTVQEDLM